MCARELAQEFAPEIMIVDLDRMTRRAVEMPMRRPILSRDAGIDIGWPSQLTGDLQRRDPRLVIGQSPDAADRLKQADEKKIIDPRVHHLEVERRRSVRIPVDDG